MGARFWIFESLCSHFSLLMCEIEIRHCFGESFLGVFGMIFFLEVQGDNVPCRFCGGPDGDGHLFWECSYPPLVAFRDSPEFHWVVGLGKTCWPRCLLWHGWLLALNGSDFGNPWPGEAVEVATQRLELAVGSYVKDGQEFGGDFLLEGDLRELAAAPDVLVGWQSGDG